MSKTNSFENQFLSHVFLNSLIPNIGDASGLPAAATEGNLYLRLYTDAIVVDDGTIGTEASYTGYAQKVTPRNASDWTVAGNNVTNAQEIKFGENTDVGSVTVRYWSLWKTVAGTLDTDRLFWGQFSADLIVAQNSEPVIQIGGLSLTED